MAYDLYGSPPYLLTIAQVDDTRAAALQLDQPAILDELLRQAGNLREDLVVLDASNLRRNLYLLTEVFDLGLPVVVALNMVDEARRGGVTLPTAALRRAFQGGFAG